MHYASISTSPGRKRAAITANAVHVQFWSTVGACADNDSDFVTPMDMLAELRDDNKQLAANLRETHGLCDEHDDVATASLLEIWIDEAERRTWFLFEATRRAEP